MFSCQIQEEYSEIPDRFLSTKNCGYDTLRLIIQPVGVGCMKCYKYLSQLNCDSLKCGFQIVYAKDKSMFSEENCKSVDIREYYDLVNEDYTKTSILLIESNSNSIINQYTIDLIGLDSFIQSNDLLLY